MLDGKKGYTEKLALMEVGDFAGRERAEVMKKTP